MNASEQREERLAQGFGRVLRLAASETPVDSSAPNLSKLTGARATRSTYLLRWGAVAALVVSAAMTFVFWNKRDAGKDPAITWVVHGVHDMGKGWVATGGGQATVVFSDATKAILAPQSRLRVLSADAEGATLLLEEGVVELDVRPREGAHWSVAAGPFVVRVTGTRFVTRWRNEGEEAQLQVQVSRGSVRVESGQLSSDVDISAGWTFRGNATDRAYDVRRTEDAPPETKNSGEPEDAQTVVEAEGAPEARIASKGLDWQSALHSADYGSIVTDAERIGIDQCIRQRSLGDLRVLSEAARFERRQDLAEKTLLGIRTRFPSTSSKEAFLLGRLEEARGRSQQAVVWYERYLEEASGGPLAADARGARLVIVARSDLGLARGYAREYLQLHPTGIHASAAKRLLNSGGGTDL